jgi:hypothetical protein
MSFAPTRRACYAGYITQTIVNNLAPLLFVVFQTRYAIPCELLGGALAALGVSGLRASLLVTIAFPCSPWSPPWPSGSQPIVAYAQLCAILVCGEDDTGYTLADATCSAALFVVWSSAASACPIPIRFLTCWS